MTFEERFWSKVNKTNTCWLWTAYKMPSGYGMLKVRTPDGTKTAYAHRVAYELSIGPIPTGNELDHLCRVRHCVNPSHLEPVSHRENCLRGESFTAKHANKTHCPQGHIYGSSILRDDGIHERRCSRCKNQRRRDFSAAMREAAYINGEYVDVPTEG